MAIQNKDINAFHHWRSLYNPYCCVSELPCNAYCTYIYTSYVARTGEQARFFFAVSLVRTSRGTTLAYLYRIIALLGPKPKAFVIIF